MRFNIHKLEQQNVQQLRALFSAIPKTEDYIQLYGNFTQSFIQDTKVAKALLYLPKHITKIVFLVNYYFSLLGDPRTTQNVTLTLRSLGNGLKDYVALVPKSIHTIHLQFMDSNQAFSANTVTADLLQVLNNIPSWIVSLALINSDAKKTSVFASVPHTVKHFWIHKWQRGRLNTSNPSLAALNPELMHLFLTENEFYRIDAQSSPNFAKGLPPKLVSLDLSQNGFNQKTANELRLLFLSLSGLKDLKILRLRDNHLSTFTGDELVQMVSIMPTTLEELDIGENGLLLLDVPSFKAIMEGLVKTLKSLRLCECKIPLTVDQLKDRFPHIPNFIKTINCSEDNLLGLSIADFLEAISWLPETVECLDISANNLHKRSVDDLVMLLSQLPAHFKRLKLRFNFLATFELGELQRILSSLPPWIKELDVSDNGFEHLPYTQTQAIWQLFPPTIKQLITGNDLQIRNDGVLVLQRGLAQIGLFQPPRRLHYQAEFAQYLIVMKQFAINCLHPDVMLRIFSYVLNASKAEMQPLVKKILAYPISSHPPTTITSAHENECLAVVAERIKTLQITDTCLDLSHCGLNRLESEECRNDFIAQLKTLSSLVTSLKLRGNGFLRNPECRKVFAALMPHIPETIVCLDLSANDFEYQSAEALSQLFLSLPSTIQRVTLDHEEPITPLLHITKRRWPEAFFRLTQNHLNKMQQARALLNDYILGDSTFWRIVSGHWNHHHIDEVARLIHYIEQRLITTAEDLIDEVEQINLTNATGSLARRFCFLAYHRPHLLDKEQPSLQTFARTTIP